MLQAELETFLDPAQARERAVPRFVERELRGFLRCGILAHGFVCVHCDDCGLDRVVGFSQKGRASVRRAAAGAWPIRPRTSSTGYCPTAAGLA